MGYTGIVSLFITDIEGGDFNVAALDGGSEACDWAYSIGLHRCYDHPELILVGLSAELSGAIVETLGEDIRKGRVVEPHEEVEIAEGLSLIANPVDEVWTSRGEWFTLGRTVMEYWGLRWPETLQLVWSDRNGARPHVPGDPRWMLKQPLLSSKPLTAPEHGRRLW